jgi:hypothetical protein
MPNLIEVKMKKYIYILFAGLSFITVHSQEISDAIRYSQDNLNGTARFRAMGGAFGALGGDISSINVNPAGSAVFSNNQIGLTLSNFSIKNNSEYLQTNTSTNNNAFDMNQAGGVFVFKNQNPNANWKKLAFTVNYEKTNNFDNSVFSAGLNTNNSIANYFLSYANPNANQGGFVLSSIKDFFYEDLNFADQQAYIGILTNVIIPNELDEENTNYIANNAGANYTQRNTIESIGYNGKLSFNGSTSYKDKLFIGLNLNSHFVDYIQSTNFSETSNNSNGVRNLSFRNDLYTYGTGFSFNLGIIGKISKEFRVGLAYESPTWYRLSDELSQNLTSSGTNFIDYSDPTLNSFPIISGSSSANSDSNVINYYDPYKLQTPGKFTGSFAYIFGKTGLISLDYTIKDYSNTKFQPKNDEFFSVQNAEMSNIFTTTSEVRIGAEYKIKALSLRGGYRFEQSPYKNKTTIGDLYSISGGLGYNFGVFKLDFAYTYAERDSQQPFFNQGFTDSAKINTQNNNVSMTFAFEL